MSKKIAAHRLGHILEKYLSRPDICARVEEQQILNCWEEIVGKGIAEVTQAVRVRNRVLQVRVVNSVWVQELQFHKAVILKKLNERIRAPRVQELWFFIGEKDPRSGPGDLRNDERPRPLRDLNRDEEAQIGRQVGELRDPEMRRVLGRLFSTALRWEKGRQER